jgi:[ribosomal protein S5]-alanine N-acetyltransferase
MTTSPSCESNPLPEGEAPLAADILTERLLLRPMSPSFLEASLATETRREAATRLGLSVPEDWFEEADLARLRLGNLRDDPSYQAWSLRALAEQATSRMVGHIGFHTRPAPEYLAAFAPRGVELGYTVYPPFRRLGYAREAIRGMIRWAHDAQGVSQFIVSIAPGNAPSMSLAAGLGFTPVGRHEDEVDGEEIVLLLEGEALRRLLSQSR